MRNFRQGNSRGGFDRRSSSSSSRFSGRSDGRERRFGDSERRPLEMHDVTCDKCKKQCQVPFRPSGDKPVYCSDCFRKNENSDSSFGSRNRGGPSQSGMSSEQAKQINAKLDKILKVLQDLEIDTEEDSEVDSDEDSEANSKDELESDSDAK